MHSECPAGLVIIFFLKIDFVDFGEIVGLIAKFEFIVLLQFVRPVHYITCILVVNDGLESFKGYGLGAIIEYGEKGKSLYYSTHKIALRVEVHAIE